MRKGLLASGLGLLAAAACGGESRPRAFEVPLRVTESAGVARKAEPISGGVPLPAGMFRPEQTFALFKKVGGEIPCQARPLVVETDGTLRWILLDFQDDVSAGATNEYVLRAAAPSARSAGPLRVEETAAAVTVDTGRIRFTISKKEPFKPFESVLVAGKKAVTGGEVSYVQLSGRKGWDDKSEWQAGKYVAGVPDSVKLRYAGPMRATVEVAGRFADDPLEAGYRAWITAWAGKSHIWIKYKLCNSNPDRYCAIPVKRSALELRLASPGAKVILGAREPISTATSEGWLHQGLHLHRTYQDIEGALKAGKGEETIWTGGGPKDRPAGWIAVAWDTTVFACDALFSSNPARRLSAETGRLVLEGIAERFEGPMDKKWPQKKRRVGQPWASEGFWLYDCSHHSSEYLLDFDAPTDGASLDALARASRSRLWVLAPPEYYSSCEVLGVGRFGSLEDEEACCGKWGLIYQTGQLPRRSRPQPGAFVAGEDNHGESEADSVQGLLLMYLRTGQRGWFDEAEAWARYHMDLQAWRTDGWRWKDGAVWFPSGGPQGNMRVREKWNFSWGPNWGKRKGDLDCADLWRHSQSKACYCHYYGSGLADYYCLTGERDALDAALDNVEQKDDEFRRYRKFTPGKGGVGSIRGFGRGFEVMVRVLQADPGNEYVRDLCRLCARALWESPLLDERGFICSRIGGGYGGMGVRNLSASIRKWMEENGISFTKKGSTVDSLQQGGKSWKVRCVGGTWQHVYIQNGADLYARYLDDEDMRDFVIAFAQMSARYMLSPKCHQTWYYTYFDVPELGVVFDPWVFDHADTEDGEGCVHSGWYTRFYPDACAKGYSWAGERQLLEKAREFWHYGSKRGYRTRNLRGGKDEAGSFAGHNPPKDDTVLSTARLFFEVSHPREDGEPPEAIADLKVKLLAGGKAEIRFTAPADAGRGEVVRYQVKAAALPIVPYEEWDYARDAGKKRNWWKAANCKGEPAPSRPGRKERFVVTGVPSAEKLYFAVRSFDGSNNRSPISDLASP